MTAAAPRTHLGVFLPTMADPGGTPGDVADAARRAEDLGFESAWVVDQLVAGAGAPLLDSGMSLAAAAAVTDRLLLAYGVAVVPLRPVAWLAKQVATLQHLSGGRVLLGVGVGGDRHALSWGAAGVPAAERGRRLDAALDALPGLVAGRPTPLPDVAGHPTVELSPGADLPRLVVGGMSSAAERRVVGLGAEWFLLPSGPEGVADARERIADRARAAGVAPPLVTASTMVVLEGDPAVPSMAVQRRLLTDPRGRFGMPEEAVEGAVVRGTPAEVAGHLSALADAGAARIVVTFAVGDWHAQADLLAEAGVRAGLLDGHTAGGVREVPQPA